MLSSPLAGKRAPCSLRSSPFRRTPSSLMGCYEPAPQAPIGCVQLLHGNGMNFYVGPLRFLPERLVNLGFACLAYNRRGHDTLSTRNSRVAEGNAFQTTAQAVADNRYATRWLAARGYDDPVVVGHSNGGMLAVR